MIWRQHCKAVLLSRENSQEGNAKLLVTGDWFYSGYILSTTSNTLTYDDRNYIFSVNTGLLQEEKPP